jgi:hypothetical protein
MQSKRKAHIDTIVSLDHHNKREKYSMNKKRNILMFIFHRSNIINYFLEVETTN